MIDVLQQFIAGWPLTASLLVGLSVLKAFWDEWHSEESGRMGQAAVISVGVGLAVIAYLLGGTSWV